MGESANESRPKLVAVPDAAAEPAAAQEGASRRGPASWLPIVAGLLALALGVTSVGWIRSAQQAGRLEASLAASEAELGRTRGALEQAEQRVTAFEGHVESARGQVSELARQIQALGSFLARDPAAREAPEGP